MLTAFGATNAISSILGGQVLQFIKLRTLLRATVVIEVLMWLFLLIWAPSPCCNELPYYVLSTCFGLIFGVLKSQIANVFNAFWGKEDIAPAMGMLGSCEAISIATIYMLGHFPAKFKIVLTMCCTVIGTLCYEYAYRLNLNGTKKKRYWSINQYRM